MMDFGHTSVTAGGTHIDMWGAGPFVIHVAIPGKSYRFEDSDRFGPVPITKSGDVRDPGYFGEASLFWPAWQMWVAQGRRLAEDGMTCIWES